MLFSTLLPITLSQKTRNFLVRCGDPHPMRLSDVFGDSSFFRYWVAGVARIGLFIEPREGPQDHLPELRGRREGGFFVGVF
jgi:hypothetical protein